MRVISRIRMRREITYQNDSRKIMYQNEKINNVSE